MDKKKIKQTYVNSMRFYSDGVNTCPSVTTVIGNVLHKPKILDWAVMQTVKYIASKKEVTKSVISKAYFYHHKLLMAYAKRGTEKHSLIERYLKTNKYEEDHFLDLFIDWQKEYDFKPLEIEKLVFNKKLGIAGRVDLIGTCHGKKFLIDLKTSKGIYLSHKIQVVAYKMGLEDDLEIGILSLNKRKKFHIVTPEEEKQCSKIYRNCKEIFNTLLKLGELND